MIKLGTLQASVLAKLAGRDGGTYVETDAPLDRTHSQTIRALDTLARHGLVTRTQAPGRMARRVYALTPAGRERASTPATHTTHRADGRAVTVARVSTVEDRARLAERLRSIAILAVEAQQLDPAGDELGDSLDLIEGDLVVARQIHNALNAA